MIDRFYYVSKNKLEIIGRQRVNWGINTIWILMTYLMHIILLILIMSHLGSM